ncbi:MAG: L-ribulose-5-phosphate 4-epimerase [Clostridiaceae bacterium]|jgi:L-ribulose-5-phosphate 4-epimerase|nr:L-ribulose-5-phosphate 4-epimerase [Bacillota bacterium]NLN51188.1 L-ribulose-5-phosphate 4-epimerase [Clostridiaceae bacterium]
MSYTELKERVYQANMQLPALDLVVFTWGNVSEVDREAGVFAIKPSGVEYDKLKPEDIVVVSLETGEKVSGDLNPSSDTATHLVLYREFPNIGGVVHTHSPWAVSWAQATRFLPAYGTTHADTFYGNVPCTRKLTDQEIAEAYEKNTGLVIVETFKNGQIDPDAVPGVLVAGHGPFTWGANCFKAVENSKVLEECCKMAVRTEQINPDINRIEQGLLDKHYLRKHGKDAYYGQ